MHNINIATIVTKPYDINNAKEKIQNIDNIISQLKARRAELGIYIVKMLDHKEVVE